MKLIDYLAKEGLNASQFAGLLQVPSSTITRVLQGKRRPGWDLMDKITKATGGAVSATADYAIANTQDEAAA